MVCMVSASCYSSWIWYTLMRLHECRIVPGKNKWVMPSLALRIPFGSYTRVLLLFMRYNTYCFYWIPSGCGHVLYSAEGVHYDGYSPVGGRRFLTTERGIAPGLVYTASLDSKWN